MTDSTATDDKLSAAANLWAFTGCVVAAAGSSALRAYVVVQLWRWFIVPFGLPSIGFLMAFGLLTLAALVRGYRRSPPGERRWRDIFGNILGSVLFSLLGWATGAVIAGAMS